MSIPRLLYHTRVGVYQCLIEFKHNCVERYVFSQIIEKNVRHFIPLFNFSTLGLLSSYEDILLFTTAVRSILLFRNYVTYDVASFHKSRYGKPVAINFSKFIIQNRKSAVDILFLYPVCFLEI